MCGIVGYIGYREAMPVLLDGLEKLEYRGYDSAGIAVYQDGMLSVTKKMGRLAVLRGELELNPLTGSVGIGHTRWATHGKPSDENAHPHTSMANDLAVVHNGIIENFQEIKDFLTEKGYTFRSQTDTEVIAHYVDYMRRETNCSLFEAVRRTLPHLEGSYALVVISKDDPEELICARKDSPLVIGIGEKENFIASDIPALLSYTREVYLLDDKDIAIVRRDGIELYNQLGQKITKEIFHVTWDVESAEKGGYPHFMIKEIHEEPRALRDTISPRVREGRLTLAEAGLVPEVLKTIKRCVITACGTAYHAGVVAKYLIEGVARVPVEVDIASEYRYRDPILNPDDLVIVVSQSGETADTLAALRLAKAKGCKVLAVTNVVGSTVSREADLLLYTWAGPEIAVASTKAYTTQLALLSALAYEMAYDRGTIDEETYLQFVKALEAIPAQSQTLVDSVEAVQNMAEAFAKEKDVFFIGRNLDYAAAMEASLKLKEISYIHSEALAAGELKHGTIALIEEGTPVVALATQKSLAEKLYSNIKEVKARGAYVLALANEGDEQIDRLADKVIYVPETV
ncbi:MAG: glutamine--fructose-6-phosphate transaminase (isomerizing), partial [Clostridia bacterium]|nr:glutamine--fructose-6-phosphate transaminase (isomerizing) [Clostridia bacterium]